MIIYDKLWKLLKDRNMKKTDLLEIVSSPTLAKLSKNDNVNVKVIGQICSFLNCQPGDIMENKSNDEVLQEYKDVAYGKLDELLDKLSNKTGKSKEELWKTYMDRASDKRKRNSDFQDIQKYIENKK